MTKIATLDVGAFFDGLEPLGVEKQLVAEKGVIEATAHPAAAAATVGDGWHQNHAETTVRDRERRR